MRLKSPFRIDQLASSITRRNPRGRKLALHDWKRFIPETVLLCAIIVAIDVLFFGGDRFGGFRFSPFWIPVLLASAQYGLIGGAFAATAATIALYAGAMPAQGAHQDFYDYASMLVEQPASWFGVAIVMGGLRTLHIHKDAQIRRSLAETEERLSTCVLGLSRATAEIENLERRIATDTGTVSRLLRGIAAIDAGSQKTLAASLGPLIADALSASTYTFYMRTSYGLEPVFSVDEEGAAVSEPGPIAAAAFESLAANPQTVVRSDPNAGQLLPPGALMLAPIAGASGQLRGALVIDRVRAPPHAHAAVAQRANNLGRVIGNMLETTDRSGAAGRDADDRRATLASEG